MSKSSKATERISKDNYYIEIAKSVYLRSTCLRIKFGVVIVKNDEIISTGYNGAPRGVESCLEKGYCWREKNNIPHGTQYEKCFTVHAEANAIISASRRDMIASTLYLAGENVDAFPCIMCIRLILNAGITRVVYQRKDGVLGIEYPQNSWLKEEFIISGRYK